MENQNSKKPQNNEKERIEQTHNDFSGDIKFIVESTEDYNKIIQAKEDEDGPTVSFPGINQSSFSVKISYRDLINNTYYWTSVPTNETIPYIPDFGTSKTSEHLIIDRREDIIETSESTYTTSKRKMIIYSIANKDYIDYHKAIDIFRIVKDVSNGSFICIPNDQNNILEFIVFDGEKDLDIICQKYNLEVKLIDILNDYSDNSHKGTIWLFKGISNRLEINEAKNHSWNTISNGIIKVDYNEEVQYDLSNGIYGVLFIS